MSPTVSITLPGLPEPEPGPIPAAAAALLRRRDHGEVAFADAPRDRTMLPELLATAARIRELATDIEVVAEGHGTGQGIEALVSAAGGPRPTRAAGRGEMGRAAYLVVAPGRSEHALWPDYEELRDRLSAEDPAGWRERIAVVTDPARGPFFEDAVRTGLPLFTWPVRAPGPHAPLTAVGLLPAACHGIDVTAVLEDAQEAQVVADEAPFADNPAQLLAAGLAAGDGWAPATAGTARLTAAARWLDVLLESFTGKGPVAGGVAIHLDPVEPPPDGVVVSGGSAGALIQTLLTGAALHGLAREVSA